MKNVVITLSLLLFVISCSSGNDSKKETKAEAGNEKIGKVEMTKTTIQKYKFEVNGEELTQTKVPYGCSAKLRINGSKGFTVKDGKVQCVVSLKLLDKNKVEVLSNPDLFKEEFPQGLPEKLFTGELSITAKFQTPCKINETYTFVGTVTDKNGEAKIVVTESFTMIPTPGLTYTENGITSDGPLLYCSSDRVNALSKNVLDGKDTLRMYLTGLSGMTQQGTLVWPDASVKLVTETGTELLNETDLYKDYEKTGVDVSVVKELLYLEMMFANKLKSGKKYIAIFEIGDKKDKTKSITARYEFTAK